MQEKAIVSVRIFPRKQSYDIEIPLDISANDLVLALNQAFHLEIDTDNILNCYLKDYGIRNGSIINITE